MHYIVFVFSLLMKDIREKSGVFEGQGDLLFFSHNVALLANDTYRTAGRLVAMSLLQGGPGLLGMSEAAYRYWVGLPVSDDMLQVQHVTDEAMRVRIAAVCCICTDGSFKVFSSGGKHIFVQI